jgi:hypothetical protein
MALAMLPPPMNAMWREAIAEFIYNWPRYRRGFQVSAPSQTRIVARQEDVLAVNALFLLHENEKKQPKLLTTPEFNGILEGFACEKA